MAQAQQLDKAEEGLRRAVISGKSAPEAEATRSAEKALRTNRILHFNNLLDAAVAAVLLTLTAAIATVSAYEWWLLLSRRRTAVLRETAPIWLPAPHVAASGKSGLASVFPLAFALLRELSTEASVERAQQTPAICQCTEHAGEFSGKDAQAAKTRTQAYLEVTEHRFKGVTRCC
jgi:carbon starvation protein